MANLSTGFGKRNLLIALGVVVVIIAGILIWKGIQIRNIRNAARQERESLRYAAMNAVMASHKEHLKLLAKPYVWAIRSEMMKGNLSQLNIYANEMIREKNFQQIVVANEKNQIISSTNKKFEGMDFSTVGNVFYLTADSTIVNNQNDSTLIISSPIMGYNNRLGTLYFSYVVSMPVFMDSPQSGTLR